MLLATAVSDLTIADALAEPRYRPALRAARARRCSTPRRVPPEPFDGFDAADLEGSIDRLVEFNRRSAKTHGIYRDLAVRRRKTEAEALLGELDGPILRRTLGLIREIEDGRRSLRAREPRAARRACAPRASGPPLNAVITVLEPAERAVEGRSAASRSRSRTTSTCRAS